MKNIKFYQIIAVIACVTCSMNILGMDQEKSTLDKLVDGTKTVVGAAYLGAKRMYYGHATLLEQELDDPRTPISPWDAVSTTNKVNRALQELENNPARATALLIKINAYNIEHPNKHYSVSDVAMNFVRSGIEQHYASQESKALAETATRMADLKAQWKVDLQTLIAQSNGKEKELAEIAAILKLVKGKQADLAALNKNFTAIHTLPENLHVILSAPEEDFTVVDTAASNNSSSTAAATHNQEKSDSSALINQSNTDKGAQTASSGSSSSSSSTLTTSTTITQTPTTATSTSSAATPSPAASSSTDHRLSNPSPFNLAQISENEESDDDAVTVIQGNSGNDGKKDGDSSAKSKKKKKK